MLEQFKIQNPTIDVNAIIEGWKPEMFIVEEELRNLKQRVLFLCFKGELLELEVIQAEEIVLRLNLRELGNRWQTKTFPCRIVEGYLDYTIWQGKENEFSITENFTLPSEINSILFPTLREAKRGIVRLIMVENPTYFGNIVYDILKKDRSRNEFIPFEKYCLNNGLTIPSDIKNVDGRIHVCGQII